MTAEEISHKIVTCLSKGYEHRTNKEKITEAMEALTPLLGFTPELKRRSEYEYAVACSESVGVTKGEPERVRLKLIEGFAAQQKAELEEIKSLEKSLHTAISSLQSLLKEYD
jgi:hypothetical protein